MANLSVCTCLGRPIAVNLCTVTYVRPGLAIFLLQVLLSELWPVHLLFGVCSKFATQALNIFNLGQGPRGLH